MAKTTKTGRKMILSLLMMALGGVMVTCMSGQFGTLGIIVIGAGALLFLSCIFQRDSGAD